jgi:hypothetical protein
MDYKAEKGRSSLCCMGQWKRVVVDGWMRCLSCFVVRKLVEHESKWVGLRERETCSLFLSPC